MTAQASIRRREFCALLGGGAIAWPLAARAQHAVRIRRIGYFAPVKIQHLIEALKDGLRDLGYVEGKNLQFEFRFAEDRSGKLDELAADLVELRPDVIVTFSTPPTLAVKRATSTIPVIMAGTGDPVRAGIVASLPRPGGNVTGVTVYGPELSRKRLEVLSEIVRGVARVGVLGNGGNPFNQLLWEDTRPAGQALGIDLRLAMVGRLDELDAAFSTLKQQGAQAVIVLADA
jgi:putative ABC transport system substrate-binding protein